MHDIIINNFLWYKYYKNDDFNGMCNIYRLKIEVHTVANDLIVLKHLNMNQVFRSYTF